MSVVNCILVSVAMAILIGAVAADSAPPQAAKAASPSVKSVSPPITHDNLTVFLLHGPDVLPGQTILTLQEALAEKKAVVHETEQVNELSVENTSPDTLLFIQSGDIVKGGKQDRAIAFDMLLPPKSGRVAIGSFCVEHGRWRQRGMEGQASFQSSTDTVTGRDLKVAVNASRSQAEVWQKVAETQDKLSKNTGKPVNAATSPSSLQLALEDKDLNNKLAGYEEALSAAIEGKTDVIGVALCVNGKVTGAEVYGSAALFRKLWPKLVKSAATEALAERDDKRKFEPAKANAVEAFLADAAAGPSKEVEMAGDGQRGAGSNRGPAQNTAGEHPRTAVVSPARIRIVRYDGKQVLLVESQDKAAAMPAVVHQCYIPKQ
jgi:hypothetical protein